MFYRNFALAVLLVCQISGIWSLVVRSESLVQSRIKGGISPVYNVKFQVSVRRRSHEQFLSGARECGGSLISENLVLTSAQCVLEENMNSIYGKPEDFVVFMGSNSLLDYNKYTLRLNITKFVTNSYDYLTYDNDIALIILDDKVPKDHPTIEPITLNEGPLEDGIVCQTYGWGHTGNGYPSEYLGLVELPLITKKNCSERTDHRRKVLDGMVCAGYENPGYQYFDTCRGDTGGPLVCGELQVGITSWGNDCGETKKPTVFTNVADYKSWIVENAKLYGGTVPEFGKVTLN